AENIERRHARISGPADRLHGDCHHGLESEGAMQWSQRQHQANRRAVGIGDDRAAGGGELRLQFTGNRGVEGGEDNLRGAFGLRWRNRYLSDVSREGSFHAPARSFGIGPAFRAIGGGKPHHFEPGMALQYLDESLPDNASGAENSYRKSVRHDKLRFYTSGISQEMPPLIPRRMRCA